MSEVIRRAIVELELRQKKGGLNAPDGGGLTRFHEQNTKATREAERQQVQYQRTVRETSYVHEEFGRRSALAMARAGHGVLQLTRGIALLGASGEEDTRKLVENLIKIEAGVSVARGAANLARFAGEFGEVGVAVAAVSAVAAVGAGIWEHHAAAERKAAKEMEEHKKQAKELADQLQKTWEEQNQRESTGRAGRMGAFEMAGDLALSPERRAGALSGEAGALRRQRQELDRTHRQRLRGFMPERFGGDAGAAFDALLQFGDKSQLTNELDYQTAIQGNVKRQASIGKEQVEAQRTELYGQAARARSGIAENPAGSDALLKWGTPEYQAQAQKRLDDAHQVYATTSRLMGIPYATRSEANESFATENGKLDKVVKAQEKFSDAMIEAYRVAQDKIDKLRRDLESGLSN